MDIPIRLLLIEDNDGDAALETAILNAHASGRYLISRVERLAEALAKIDAEPFDVALVDIGLPDSVGLDTITRLAERAPALPLVVLTGLHDDAIGPQAILHGAEDYLVKGENNGASMARTLQHAIERKRLEIGLRNANETLESCVAERTANLAEALRAVRESEERYRTLTESATEAIITTDRAGTIVDWNPAAQRIFGYAPGEAIGRPFPFLIPPRHHALLRDLRKKLLFADLHQTAVDPIELEALRKDGTEFALELLLARWQVSSGLYFTGFMRDITRRKQTEIVLQIHERAFEASANAVIISSARAPDYPVEYVNPAFERITGYAAGEVIGRSLRIMHADDVGQPGVAEIQDALRERREGHATLRNYRKDGSMYWTEVYLAPVRGVSDEISHFVAIKYDITETKRYQAELEFHTSRDALTGLPNRNLLYDRINQAIGYGSRYGHPVWIACLNLDRFTLLTSALGHQNGDRIVKAVSERLAAIVRASDTLARVGTDEFALVLPERNDNPLDPAVLQRLLDAVVRPLEVEGHELVLSAGLGVAIHPADGGDAETLMKHAGIAMRRAKEVGRNRFQFYAPAMNDRALDRLRVMADLRDALVREEFVLHYQPQVDFRSGRIVGMEALIRWNHPQLGLLPPARFIGVAEETDLIVAIGAWVARAASRQCKAWQDAGFAGLRVAINLSARQFANEDLVRLIVEALRDTGLAPQCLELELTESTVMSEIERSIQIMNSLKALGVQLSIDDFGTGYSSLAYLKNFPIDALKIDRSFVSEIAADKGSAAIAKAIISMAHALGIRVVAEGGETEQQCAFLAQNLCDELQGYFFSPPLPPAPFEELLRQERCLPAHLLRTQDTQRTLLIVDDEANIVSSLKRLLRRDDYRILSAGSGPEGLEILRRYEYAVDVIIADQRMPGMTGVEFLRAAKELYPDSVRIVLSGYTELQSVTDAVNEGAIYKFLTKPWNDEQLRGHILEAFQHRKLVDENQRLTIEIQTVNQDLAATNRELSALLKSTRQQVRHDELSLDITREALQCIPLPVIGLDEDNMIIFVNDAAQEVFRDKAPLLGGDAAHLLPELARVSAAEGATPGTLEYRGARFEVAVHGMGRSSSSRGHILTLIRRDAGG